MTRIGITGHRGLPAPTTRLVAHALHDALADYDASVTGVNSLADGADQLFVRAVLGQGGQIEVIVPAARYRDGLPDETHPEYDDLLRHASTVHRLEFVESTAQAHMAASKLMISMISELFAVWDQQPARGLPAPPTSSHMHINRVGGSGLSGQLAQLAIRTTPDSRPRVFIRPGVMDRRDALVNFGVSEL